MENQERERGWAPLSLSERQVIWVMRSKGSGVRKIARAVGRDASTVSRELKRNAPPWRVALSTCALGRARLAHEKAHERRRRARRGRRLRRLPTKVYEHITERLKEGWSLEAISARIGDVFSGYSISVSTLYRVIKRDRADLKPYLPERGKPRRARVAHRRSRFKTKQGATPKRSIEARPESVLFRNEAGHFEGDTIVGKKKGSKEAILSLCERHYRLRYYVKVENLEAATVRRAMMRLLHSMPEQLRQTITLDNGGEFAEWEQIEKVFPGMKVYFCHPYASHEKGSVERSNRDFRYFAPKGTDFSSLSEERIAEINERINNRPMKCLGWKTPRECFLESLH